MQCYKISLFSIWLCCAGYKIALRKLSFIIMRYYEAPVITNNNINILHQLLDLKLRNSFNSRASPRIPKSEPIVESFETQWFQ